MEEKRRKVNKKVKESSKRQENVEKQRKRLRTVRKLITINNKECSIVTRSRMHGTVPSFHHTSSKRGVN